MYYAVSFRVKIYKNSFVVVEDSIREIYIYIYIYSSMTLLIFIIISLRQVIVMKGRNSPERSILFRSQFAIVRLVCLRIQSPIHRPLCEVKHSALSQDNDSVYLNLIVRHFRPIQCQVRSCMHQHQDTSYILVLS